MTNQIDMTPLAIMSKTQLTALVCNQINAHSYAQSLSTKRLSEKRPNKVSVIKNSMKGLQHD
ncbi:hypothetical protein L2735_15115 [Shewanella olleyana]|uniref:hypothetical protein n=1 Tax=Shewanella olleyana TaxID=135626 RepID=UPI00200D596E|nr:hypothetical protein [Shewanella olleyana]MCL1068118.1 hypothetical protein [Shewanella olleyana]